MSHSYQGTELALFAGATQWKTYLGETLAPYVRGRVLDVGAGIGGNMRPLANARVTHWDSVEPDPRLAGEIRQTLAQARPEFACSVINGTIAAIPHRARYDTILYMDVLEHIENDASELHDAAGRLAQGGCLVVLVPAHQFLFSPFDKAVGHHRRYGLRQLRSLTPLHTQIEMCRLLDSVGFFASLANRALLRQASPTGRQIATWDRFMIPASRVLDPIAGYRFGKSALMVWRAAHEGDGGH